MSLTLHYHPLSSFCFKALIGLYELDVPFEKHLVDLGDAASRAAFVKVWPIGKFPVLEDEAKGLVVPESTTILEYVDQHHPGKVKLVPADPDQARECRLRDRFYDLHIHLNMQKIVGDKLRAEGQHDPTGVAEARKQMETAYGIADALMRERTWALGDDFGMADCSASPALFYGNKMVPFGDSRPHLTAYLARLMARPAYARVLEEAAPYFKHFPG